MKPVRRSKNTRHAVRLAVCAVAASALATPQLAGQAGAATDAHGVSAPKWTRAVAHDTSQPLRDLASLPAPAVDPEARGEEEADTVVLPLDVGQPGDGALQRSIPTGSPGVSDTTANFEGLSNDDNFSLYGFRVNPPDTVGDVGLNHYVQMVNLAYAVYSKTTGNRLLGPVPVGNLWSNFAVPDCADASGDPVVLYDQLSDRWILSQFTTSGLDDPALPFYNCIAISTTGDPTGTYYRYAFSTGLNFPDYPKYGVWTDSYVITTREFGPTTQYGIGVYGLEKNKMLNGQSARAVQFYIDGNAPDQLPLVGDGLLPADVDGKTKPKTDTAIPLVGTQDDNSDYGATFDALNIWDLRVKWRSSPVASLTLNTQLPTAAFDSVYPCGPTARDCLAQPGITDPARYLDVQSYRQRPIHRLAYRSFGTSESLVTNQSVEAAPGRAGVRWYQIQRNAGTTYSLSNQGTFAPSDGVNRWMGSVAQDKFGNMAAGYSVVNGTDVYPGIRYTGRLKSDPPSQLTLGEKTVKVGTGSQFTTNSRWGDYSSMNVDPVDDCTFWYTSEYYAVSGNAAVTAPWQTRIASFKLPGC